MMMMTTATIMKPQSFVWTAVRMAVNNIVGMN